MPISLTIWQVFCLVDFSFFKFILKNAHFLNILVSFGSCGKILKIYLFLIFFWKFYFEYLYLRPGSASEFQVGSDVNFKKAKWGDFKKITEEKFAKTPLPTDVYKGERIFRNILNKTAKKTIPKGQSHFIIIKCNLVTGFRFRIQFMASLDSDPYKCGYRSKMENAYFTNILVIFVVWETFKEVWLKTVYFMQGCGT